MVTLVMCCVLGQPASLPLLKVSENQRSLVKADGKPFFYLADTGWELFHRLNREEAEVYLKKRAGQGFTVIQAVVLAEFDGLSEPNPYGHLPLKDNDPTKPVEAYFEHVDWVVKKANALGLYIGMLPTWGDKVNKKWGKGPEIFSSTNAKSFGNYLGQRYRNAGVIWILGGDRPVEKPEHMAIWKAMAAGLRAGDGGSHLVTYHPMGSGRSRAHFAGADDILDFHTQQNGHNIDVNVAERITKDYQTTPTKPILDMEPLYEGHPIDFKVKEKGHSNAADIRKFAYWSVFSGSCGHTYGHHSVWQFYSTKRPPINLPLVTWNIAIDFPGAHQMNHLRKLIESHTTRERIPDMELVAEPSAGGKRIVACRDVDGAWAMVYVPTCRVVELKTGLLHKGNWKISLFDPRTGLSQPMETFTQELTKMQTVKLPNDGENQDWVIVLELQTSK